MKEQKSKKKSTEELSDCKLLSLGESFGRFLDIKGRRSRGTSSSTHVKKPDLEPRTRN